MTTDRKQLNVRLDPDVFVGLEQLCKALDVDKSVVVQAAVELWVARWLALSRDVAAFEAHYRKRPTNGLGAATTMWDAWIVRARRLKDERLAEAIAKRAATRQRKKPPPLRST